MMRAVLLAASVWIAVAASAATRVLIEPAPPFHADEEVTITLRGEKGFLPPGLEVDGDNITLIQYGTPTGSQAVWKGTLYSDSGSGQIVVRGPGPFEGPTRIPFTILPPLLQPWTDPAAELRRLRAANRPLILVRPELLTPFPYVGQRATVIWHLYYETVGDSYRDSDPREYGPVADPSKELPGMEARLEFEPQHWSETDPLGGIPMRRLSKVKMSFVPKKPGRMVIPPVPFHALRTKRMAPALEVYVRPLPREAEGLPVGTFRLECHPAPGGYWPAAVVQAMGEDRVPVALRQSLIPKLPYAVTVERREDATRSIFRAHSRDAMTFPMPKVRIFNPQTQKVEELSCPEPVPVRLEELRTMDVKPLLFTKGTTRGEERIRGGEPRDETQQAPPDPEAFRKALERGRIITAVMAALGLAGVALAFRA